MRGRSKESKEDAWPELKLADWHDTCATLHMWLQIAGKVRLVQAPRLNHSWHSTFYVTCRGLTTSPIPYEARAFQIDFDFVDHRLSLASTDGRISGFPLTAMSVAEFYERFLGQLNELGLSIRIRSKPNEVAEPIPFAEDTVHRAYDAKYAQRFWQALVQSERVLQDFRARFIGKCSPVHLFWGAPDLAVTRFSGRPAPLHPGGVPHLPDRVTQEAYSHEVISCGFWPGGGGFPEAAYYAYAYPEPEGFSSAKLDPSEAFYSAELREFILPYDAVRGADSPDEKLLSFFQSSYEVAADLARWDRRALEWSPEESVRPVNPHG